MDQKIINLYDRFTHGAMARREFLDRLAQLAGSTAAAAALLPLLQNDYAQAAIVADNDPRLKAERVSYDSPTGKINGYLVRGTAGGKRPAVIVIHENRGLNPHIEDVARRLAVEGYLAFAPDLLSVAGGTPPTEDAARELHTKTNKDDMLAAALAAVPFMQKHAESTGKVGAVGFCYGGGVVNRLAAGNPDLARGRAVLRHPGAARSRSGDPRPAAAAIRRDRREHQQGHRGLRGGAEGQQQDLHAAHLSGYATRLQQRYRRRALQQGGGRSGMEQYAGVLRAASRRAAEGSLAPAMLSQSARVRI